MREQGLLLGAMLQVATDHSVILKGDIIASLIVVLGLKIKSVGSLLLFSIVHYIK